MKSILKPEHGSLEWLQLRHKHDGKTIVGASEVSAVMGVNPYKNIIDLAIDKMQPPVVREQNQAMKRGTYLEQGLLDYASAEIGSLIVTPAMMYLNGRIISTLDGVTNDSTRLFEAKTTTGWVQGDECLPEWFWQAQAQMHCTEATTVTFIVLDRQLRITMFDVSRDDEAIADMVAKVELFCTAIDEERLPEDVPLSAEQVAQLHPTPDAGEIELGAAGLELVQRWQTAKELAKQYADEEQT
jgi:putative phage-type endonuclease